jgi:hypothetical protein
MKVKKNILKILIASSLLLLVLTVVGIIYTSKQVSCTPYNVFLSKVGDNSIKLSWRTKDACLGYVLYGESAYDIERVAINSENLGKSKQHEVTIPNLLSTNDYHFIVVSNEQPYGNTGKPITFSLGDLD